MTEPDDLFAAAFARHQAGELAEAEALYEQLLTTRPDHVDGLHLLGALALQQGRTQEAVSLIGEAVRLDPDAPFAQRNFGFALGQLNRLDEALTACEAAIRLKPDFAEAMQDRIDLLTRLERPTDLLTAIDAALALNPDDGALHNSRGNVLCQLKRPGEAVAAYERAMALEPGSPEPPNNLGNALTLLDRPAEALPAYDRALAIDPGHLGPHNNRANALNELGRPLEALAGYDAALSLSPGDGETRWNRALVLLLLGRYDEGFAEYEARKIARRPVATEYADHPLWLGGEDITGKTVLLHHEQGLGDAIQMARYAPMVRARGARVILTAPPALAALFAGMDPDITVLSDGEAPPFDYHCPLMSLPLVFGVQAPGRYIQAPPAAVAYWAERLGPRRRPRIGLAWRGNPEQKKDYTRSMSLEALHPLLAEPGIDWVVLQKDLTAAELQWLGGLDNVTVLGPELADFSDTAAVVEQLDRVITVCTSVAHLAGALDTPVWVMLAFNADWRWLLERDDSPWYPSARLFRQDGGRQWGPVIARVRETLEAAV